MAVEVCALVKPFVPGTTHKPSSTQDLRFMGFGLLLPMLVGQVAVVFAQHHGVAVA